MCELCVGCSQLAAQQRCCCSQPAAIALLKSQPVTCNIVTRCGSGMADEASRVLLSVGPFMVLGDPAQWQVDASTWMRVPVPWWE
jgi:hypothetical protein